MLKIGHRGAMGHAPENTIASFKKALEFDIDAIELDVYKCKSGEIVVIHDDKVDRTTNSTGYVEQKTYEELSKLNAGDGKGVPLLTEILDLIDKKVIVNIELKGENTALPVGKIIKNYIDNHGWSEAHFMISSFNHYELLEFKQLFPKFKIGALLEGIPLGYCEFAEKLGAYSVNLGIESINKKIIDDAHKRGLKVYVWTVNDHDEIDRIKNLGVDGIFSNFPERL